LVDLSSIAATSIWGIVGDEIWRSSCSQTSVPELARTAARGGSIDCEATILHQHFLSFPRHFFPNSRRARKHFHHPWCDLPSCTPSFSLAESTSLRSSWATPPCGSTALCAKCPFPMLLSSCVSGDTVFTIVLRGLRREMGMASDTGVTSTPGGGATRHRCCVVTTFWVPSSVLGHCIWTLG